MASNLDKIRGMSLEELSREEKDVRDQIWKLRMQLSTGQLDSPQTIRRVRHDLARILTVRRERERAEAGGGKR